MRTQTYIFLQKLGRILAGGASHKIKSDKWYFYYRYEKCRNNIQENKIEEKIKNLLSDIMEYDNVVNDMYEDEILDDDGIKNLDLTKEKDGFER